MSNRMDKSGFDQGTRIIDTNDTDSLVLDVDGANAMAALVQSSSSMIGKFQVSLDGGAVWGDIEVFRAGVRIAPGSLVTLAQGQVLVVPCLAASKIQWVPTSGSGVVQLRGTEIGPTVSMAGAVGTSAGNDSGIWKSDGSDLATVFKAAPGVLKTLHLSNVHATEDANVRLYNKASDPAAGDVSLVKVHSLLIPAKSGREAVFSGLFFNAGIAMRGTRDAAIGSTTPIGADEVFVTAEFE
jgi:hypothetical protein